ncbi:uncharacterized protein RCO7_11451 [Rhynchosporium graminicola]|uniref:Uncharacterized protein n=1 Tax=Rhynchosporium graminicola TaxID=2792576 RepID=A0A1E1KUP9_9HELO|nr:uncharacterized protein RCO7_11451 [Rhynchosporium commune]
MDENNESVSLTSAPRRSHGNGLSGIPFELLEMMFMDGIALGPDRQVPPLLLALGTCKDLKNVYRIMHIVRTLTEYPTAIIVLLHRAGGIDLKGAKILCMNKISTLTLDFTMIDDTIDIQEGARSVSAGDHLEQYVFWTIRASTRGVEKLTVITPEAMSELRKLVTLNSIKYCRHKRKISK